MNADSIKIEWDEDGCYLLVHVQDTDHVLRCRLIDPEQAYDAVQGGIGPWLYERDQANRTFICSRENIHESGGYDLIDPKHPAFHSTHVAIWDEREKGGL